MHFGIQIFIMLFYAFIFLTGLINAINPRFMWKTFESWKATKEPTETYFRVRRIQGVVVMIIISIVAFGPYVMSRLN
jgi:hypothetical protein